MEFGVQGSGANEFGQLEGWNVGGGYVRVWERRLRGEEDDGDQVVEQAEHHHHLEAPSSERRSCNLYQEHRWTNDLY